MAVHSSHGVPRRAFTVATPCPRRREHAKRGVEDTGRVQSAADGRPGMSKEEAANHVLSLRRPRLRAGVAIIASSCFFLLLGKLATLVERGARTKHTARRMRGSEESLSASCGAEQDLCVILITVESRMAFIDRAL